MNKPYSDSYLKKMTKDEIIDILRCAEHGWKIAEEQRDLISFELEYFTNQLMQEGMKITDVNQRLFEAQVAWEKSIKQDNQ